MVLLVTISPQGLHCLNQSCFGSMSHPQSQHHNE